MPHKFFKTAVIILFGLLVLNAQAQTPPFFKEVQLLKKLDSVNYPLANNILFTGSSSFTKWTDVNLYFPGYPIVNRAFGGSSLPDLINYVKEVIVPYKSRQVVIYCGDNDLAANDSITPLIVLQRFKQLFALIRKHLPSSHVLYVAIKPSPSRERLMPKMEQANNLIRNFLKSKKRATFADVYHPMLLPNGKPNPTLFVEDRLHMNAKGYAIWQKVLTPYLVK